MLEQTRLAEPSSLHWTSYATYHGTARNLYTEEKDTGNDERFSLCNMSSLTLASSCGPRLLSMLCMAFPPPGTFHL